MTTDQDKIFGQLSMFIGTFQMSRCATISAS